MSPRKEKPPAPSVDILAQRFSTSVTPASHTSVTQEEEGLPVPKSQQAAKPKTRPAPAGMARRSVYTRADALDALMEAGDRLVAATNGFVTKADAIAELLLAGVAAEERVLDSLKQQVQERVPR